MRYDSQVRHSDITDGLSHTLLIGERPPGPDESGVQQRYGWWYSGSGYDRLGRGDAFLNINATNTSFRHPTCPIGPYAFQRGNGANPCDIFHFWSPHPGGANFAMCDGSVHFIAYSIDAPTFLALGSRNGGEVVTEPIR